MPHFFPPSPAKPGTTSFDFPPGAADAPRYTSMQKLYLTGGTHDEQPDPAGVRFLYVLEGEGAVSSGGTESVVRPGSSVFLPEGESLRLVCVSAPLVLLRVAVNRGAGRPHHAP